MLKQLIALIAISAAAAVGASNTGPSVVLIGVDGMGASGFERAKTPVMNKLLADGWYSNRARAVFKTSSGPNWASVLSGVGPEQHGVLDNAWRPGKSPIKPTLANDIGGFLTLMDYVAKAYPERPRSALYGWAEFDYLLGTAAMDKRYFSVEGVSGPQRLAAEIKTTEDTGIAAVAELEKNPALLFVHYDIVDHALHTYSVDSPQYIKAIELVDQSIGKIVAALGPEDTVIITADHGGKGKQHGGFTTDEQEVPMLIRGPRARGGKAIAVPVNIYDSSCTALDALGIPRPLGLICKSLLAPEVVADRGHAAQSLLPRPGVSRGNGVYTLSVDHADAEIYYRLGRGLGMGPWQRYRQALALQLPQRIETQSRLGQRRSRIYGRDLLRLNSGVKADLFAGRWSMLPDLAQLEPVASFSLQDFTLEQLPYPKEYFGVRFQARFNAPEKGRYRFRIKVDDGGSLYVNGKRLAHEPEPKGSRFASGEIDLEQGPAELDVRYYQTYGSIAFSLDVKAPGASEYEAIPAHLLSRP